MAGEPLTPMRRAAIEGWAARNPHARQARAIRALLAEIDRLQSRERPSPPCPLTPRQLSAVVGVANGESAHATARRVGIGKSGVDALRVRAYDRLRVGTAAQAVAVCMSYGWISGEDLNLPDLSDLGKPRVHERDVFLKVAAELRTKPGQWMTVRTCTGKRTAWQIAYRLRTGRVQGFQPPGAFEAETFTDGSSHGVRARYVGESAAFTPGGCDE